MVLPNPAHTYKALLLDYDALLGASDRECSVCLSEREIQIILAFVEYIGWKTRYIATETEIDVDLILRWQGNLARKLMTGCCGDDGVLHRYTEGGIYQTSEDGGDTWVDDPEGDPRNTGTQAPPLPGEASDAKRCAAADNVRSLFKNYRDNLVSILTSTPLLLEILSGIVAFIGVLIGVSGVGIGISVLFLTLAAQLVSMTPGDVNSQINEGVLDDFKCLVYCRMNNDGELTYASWQGLLEDIAGFGFTSFAETFFYQTVAGMGYIGVNNAATMGDSTADDCEDCDCATACGDPGLITYGTVIEQGMEGGNPYLIIESVHFPDAGGFQLVAQNTYGNTSPPATLCFVLSWEVVAGYEGPLTTGWTGASGDVHDPSNPAGVTPGVSHFYFATSPGNDTPFTVKVVY